jgi:prevent-host-death family protein
MKFIQVREVRIRYGKVMEQLKKEKKIVLTSKGKPVALLTDLSEDNFEEQLSHQRHAEFASAVRDMQKQSVKMGLDKMTDKEIETEIKAARRTKKT